MDAFVGFVAFVVIAGAIVWYSGMWDKIRGKVEDKIDDISDTIDRL